MSQSFSVVYVHAIFSTKDRGSFLADKSLRLKLHAYLGEVSKRLGCTPVRVGGVEDHVHVLALLGRSISQSDWVKELKRASSIWLKSQSALHDLSVESAKRLIDFSWQRGYASFSVSKSNLESVIRYIENQEEHHQKISFKDEFRAFLIKHDETWNEEYIWD